MVRVARVQPVKEVVGARVGLGSVKSDRRDFSSAPVGVDLSELLLPYERLRQIVAAAGTERESEFGKRVSRRENNNKKIGGFHLGAFVDGCCAAGMDLQGAGV